MRLLLAKCDSCGKYKKARFVEKYWRTPLDWWVGIALGDIKGEVHACSRACAEILMRERADFKVKWVHVDEKLLRSYAKKQRLGLIEAVHQRRRTRKHVEE